MIELFHRITNKKQIHFVFIYDNIHKIQYKDYKFDKCYVCKVYTFVYN